MAVWSWEETMLNIYVTNIENVSVGYAQIYEQNYAFY